MSNERFSYFHYNTPYGYLTIGCDDDSVIRLDFGKLRFEGILLPSEASNICANQILEYFSGKRSVFTVPISMHGSDFQKEVWSAICNIPYGQTRTALDIAESIGRPSSHRMVGSAIREAPIALLIPVHRIVRADGYYDKSDPISSKKAAIRELEKRFS